MAQRVRKSSNLSYKMSGLENEMKLELPWYILDRCAGISFDIGGSVIKIAYLHKDDWVKPEERKKDSTGTVRFISFSKENHTKAFEYIKPNVHIMRNFADDITEIYTTGHGGNQYSKQIKEVLSVRNINITEMDCFIQAFVHILKTFSRKELLHELHQPAFEAAKRECDQFRAIMGKFMEKTDMKVGDIGEDAYSFSQSECELSDQVMTQEEGIFPCLLLNLGSGFGVYKVYNEDGRFALLDGSKRGGRMFLGLGSLLTGAKTYEELMSLAETGHNHNVSTTNLALVEGMEKSDKDIYHMAADMDEATVYSFGHAAGKDKEDFKKEDVARCLLETMMLDIVQVCFHQAAKHKVKHVFCGASFTSHPVARQVMLREWLRRDLQAAFLNPAGGHQCQLHFLKHGPYLGAFGAFLNSKLKFSEQAKHPRQE